MNNATHWVGRRPVRLGRHKAWNTVCAGGRLRLEDRLRHRRRPPGDGARRQRQDDVRRVVRACNPATGPSTAGWPPTTAGRGTSWPGRPAEPLHHLDRRRPGERGARVHQLGSYSRRWIPDAGVGHVFETTNGGATWTDVTGQPPGRARLQGRHPRRPAGRRERGRRVHRQPQPAHQLVAARPEPAERDGVGSRGDARCHHRGRGHARPRPVGAPAALTQMASPFLMSYSGTATPAFVVYYRTSRMSRNGETCRASLAGSTWRRCGSAM